MSDCLILLFNVYRPLTYRAFLILRDYKLKTLFKLEYNNTVNSLMLILTQRHVIIMPMQKHDVM